MRSCDVYGADGARLKLIENLSPTQDCTAIPASAPATVYFGAVEIRNWQIAGQEQVITCPHPAVRLVNGSTITAASYLHRDALGSVRAITDAAGAKVESAVYKPFGEQTEWLSPAAPAPEAKGWIGERYDASAGLQYLNARYYDPELGMFLQPDWFEVTEPGVGRNRYSYSFNDPVNGRDPGGNITKEDAALLSEYVYDELEEAPDGFEIVDASQPGLDGAVFVDAETGLNSRLYRNKGTGEYTLAFAGTIEGFTDQDWQANGAELLGASAQYTQAIRLSRQVSNAVRHEGGDLSFVGHSLGGGLAQASALAVRYSPHREAKTFNSAGVSLITSLRSARRVFDSAIDVQNYAVLGDPLTFARRFDGVLANTTYMLLPPGSSWNLGYRHSIEAVRLGLNYNHFLPGF